jgi:hypothetical protein
MSGKGTIQARALRTGHYLFHSAGLVQGGRNFFPATFVPCPGILLRTRPHLTVLEAVGLRCFLQADLPRDPGLRLKNGSAQDDSQPERGGALDLSIRQMFK